MKRYLAAVLAAAMLFGAYPAFAQDTLAVWFEGEELDGAKSFVHADEAYLPIRAICESMGFEVDWDNEIRGVIVGEKPETAVLADDVSLYIDSKNIDAEIVIVNSLSYMPADDMREAFEVEIERNDAEGVIYVTLAKSAALDGRYYWLKDEATGQYLTADYSDFENGVKIALEDKSSSESQLWGFNSPGDGSYTVFVKGTRQYITSDAALGRDAEKLSLSENEDGSVKIISGTGLMLTINDGFAAWEELDEVQQSFTLEYAGAISKGNDTFGTTFGAHDPAIFKDPETGIYYAYNTDAYSGQYETEDGETAVDDYPMDTFRSEDLINWERIDNNFRIPQSAIDFCEEIFAPMGSAMNVGIWAPDIFYAEEDTEHPYWLYYSLSTNGTDFDYIRSLVGLVKGETPTGPWVDCGVVISSDETGSLTNAIDQNIYEDTDGTRFFIWGSFQKGIFQVKLTEDGHAEGVDYTSNETIHASSMGLGDGLYATPNGVHGPEGAYMINGEDYRYMFVSYGWLGTNYNVRVARNSIENAWEEETAEESNIKLTDHNERAVGTSFDGQEDNSEFWGYKLTGSYQLGDGVAYCGSGHCSVLCDDDGSWYLVEHCRETPDGMAKLSVRKMLWTQDGWPVVSPISYYGEKEHEIEKEKLVGTWALASVGVTIKEDGVSDINNWDTSKKCDLTVYSSEITLCEDGTLADGLGRWEFDENYTVTLYFEADGNEEKYEFYKAGDVMTMYVLEGFDRDTQSDAIVMTGVDQNHITQFGRKNSSAASRLNTGTT